MPAYRGAEGMRAHDRGGTAAGTLLEPAQTLALVICSRCDLITAPVRVICAWGRASASGSEG